MSWLGRSTQIMGACRGCLLQGSPITLVGRAATISRQPVRYATTATKPRAKRAAAPASEDLVSVPKKNLSTKSPATSSAKSPRKKKADVEAAEPTVSQVVGAAPKKRSRAASTEIPPNQHKHRPNKTRRFDANTAVEAPAQAPAPSPATPEVEVQKPRKPADVKSPEFKAASRKYTALMVALPILVVTSYYLFDRLVLGNEPKDLESFRKKPVLPEAEAEAEAEAKLSRS